ncbi:MAG: FmdB family zinc ribbon protein [Planctomycetota bacterium]|jgi:putative FmdB family regulatory protein
MPIYDFECGSCGAIHERYARIEEEVMPCEECASDAYRIISVSGHYCANEDAPWLKSVLEVVDKDPNKAHCQDFLKSPTRSNWKRWMAGEGLKPAGDTHHGGPIQHQKPLPPDMGKVEKEVWKEHRKRNRIEIR